MLDFLSAIYEMNRGSPHTVLILNVFIVGTFHPPNGWKSLNSVVCVPPYHASENCAAYGHPVALPNNCCQVSRDEPTPVYRPAFLNKSSN